LDDVLTPAMLSTREAWHRGEITKAQEGLLCASARRTFGALIATYRRRADGPVMVLATLPDEHEDIGLMITALLAVTQGCDCIDLGSDVSVDDIIAAVMATDARCVSLSCVTRKPSCRVVPPLSDLCNRLPQRCEIWLGGSNACDLDAADLPERCVRIAGTDALQQRLNLLCASQLPNA
jgi:methanogenic corrinoid protein MtbC1